ncbi:MAG: hypothetical protein IT282_16950, partial [Bacteroidetes bacterium]|nr:hypothetical protein [Bacteroidota bacterium]
MRSLLCIAFMTGTLLHGEAQAEVHAFRQPLKTDGSIPVWLVAGPFEQGIQGFGDWRSLDAVGESTVHPRAGATLPAPLVSGGLTTWQPQSADARNYLDLNATLGWAIPGKTVEQVWWTKAGYAYVGLESPVAQTVHLLAGTNSQMVVILNGTQLHEFAGERDA